MTSLSADASPFHGAFLAFVESACDPVAAAAVGKTLRAAPNGVSISTAAGLAKRIAHNLKGQFASNPSSGRGSARGSARTSPQSVALQFAGFGGISGLGEDQGAAAVAALEHVCRVALQHAWMPSPPSARRSNSSTSRTNYSAASRTSSRSVTPEPSGTSPFLAAPQAAGDTDR